MLNEGPLTSIKWEVSMGEISKGGVEKLDPNKALNLEVQMGINWGHLLSMIRKQQCKTLVSNLMKVVKDMCAITTKWKIESFKTNKKTKESS